MLIHKSHVLTGHGKQVICFKKESSTRAFPALLLLHLVPRCPADHPFLSLVMLIIQLAADAERKASGLQDPWVGGQMYS